MGQANFESDIRIEVNSVTSTNFEMDEAPNDVNMDLDEHQNINLTAAAARQAYDAVSSFAPFVPYVESIFGVITEIINIYDNVEYNKKTCRVLVDRVETVKIVIRKLIRRKDEEELFRDQDYYHAFIRLDNVLKNIKRFVREVSQYKNLRRVLLARNIQEESQDLMRKLENACSDLKFGIIISIEERQKEQASIKEDFDNMKNMMSSWDDKLNLLIAQISEMTQTERGLKVDFVDPNRLSQRVMGNRGRIVKRILDQFMPVACKPVVIGRDEQNSQKFKNKLAILGKLHASPKIIRFYGLSTYDGINYMIFEWAELGNLKNYYQTEYISPEKKLQFATNIAEGLRFLQVCGIYHHDVRCENIMITREDNIHTTAKLANFDISREISKETTMISDISELVRWMAPEKLANGGEPSRNNYTYPCEVFSFGMLLWELLLQKLPYEKMRMDEICKHIKEGKREFLNFPLTLAPTDMLNCFKQIIKKAWAQDPNDRPTIIELHTQLQNLLSSRSPGIAPKTDYVPYFEAPNNYAHKNYCNDFDEHVNLVVDDTASIEIIIPLEEGLRLHKESRGCEKAWKCFEKHASLGDPLAIYWKGYYLHEGYYVEKNFDEATKLFKEAADMGLADAQLRYAFSLLEMRNPYNYPEVMSYLEKARLQENPTALYHLGDIYYNGKLDIEKDETKGLEYLKLAAIKKQPKAMEFFAKNKLEFLE
ncbi:17986_t:CDS:2 [Acaulospora morrowiae]|uniref:17986_t:CDS:1 n=1 Tax=Acaulospora morrowiae TaxID=94023 RepID=A0A9N9C5C0_9GLOM|nr:17986_t:CDS:2 [Acaulospora morrowiae]